MKRDLWKLVCVMATVAALWMSTGGNPVRLVSAEDQSAGSEKNAGNEDPADAARVSLREARQRAELLHETLTAVLDTIHRSYFKRDGRLPVPSRVLESVFFRIKRQTGIEACWLAVNTPAMSLDHEPEDSFEKQAAKALAAGQRTFEQVEDGCYRRAESITLFASCLKCHLPTVQVPKRPRVAALSISVPFGRMQQSEKKR